MTAPLLQLSNIRKNFGAVRALQGVSFDLFAGEVHALVGENGAGKSTLIRIITGALQPDSGDIQMDGRSVAPLTPASGHALGIAAIYQQPALFPDLSIAENIALGVEEPTAGRLVHWKERRRQAVTLLERVGAQLDPDTEVRQLSMPQQQLVEIARALGAGARILLMDEPSASLSRREVDLLLDLVRSLRAHGVGIIYISHRLEEVFRIANRVTVLRDGVSVGTRAVSQPADVESSQKQPLSAGQSTEVEPLNESVLIRMMVGREVSIIFPPSEAKPGPIALEVQHVSCRRAGIHDVTLNVRSGEILGLAGLVGAGRTELACVLFGLTPADTGTISINGTIFPIDSPAAAIKAGMAYLPEDRRRHGVILEMPIAANISLGILRRLFPRTWMRFGAERSLADRYVRELSIKTLSAETPARNLSGGNQQKVALARWLAVEPKVLILDEPTQGVDVGAKAEIHKIIRQLSARGMAVLLISSELPEILGMSDRIAVMRGGTVTAHFDSQSAEPHAVMAAAVG